MKKEDTEQPSENRGTQLNKILSNAGIASRRNCAEFIREGKVKVNGKTIIEPGFRVTEKDSVFYNGKKVENQRKYYVLLNKPKDFITTTSDDRGRKTVMELIEDATKERLFPVGRLDRNTTGVLLLTNDGDLAQKLGLRHCRARKAYIGGEIFDDFARGYFQKLWPVGVMAAPVKNQQTCLLRIC